MPLIGAAAIGALPIGAAPFFVPALIPRARPNGNWRSIIDDSAKWILPDNNILSPSYGEVGFTLYFNTPTASSAQIADMALVFVKPSGQTLSVSSQLFYPGKNAVGGDLGFQQTFIAYTFGLGDLDETGWWSVYLTLGGARTSGFGRFRVINPPLH